MSRRSAAATRCIAIALALVLTQGCVFPGLLEFFITGDGTEGFNVSLSATSSTGPCELLGGGPASFACALSVLFGGDGDFFGQSLGELTGEELLFLLFLDPVVLQIPAEASSLAGSYSHLDGGGSGALQITAGLASVPVDVTRALEAEPGMQLVILELPPGAPTTGDFAWNFNFAMPPGTSALPIKALLTGRVDAGGTTYYPPLFPCTSDLAQVAQINPPFPAGGQIALPVAGLSGCDGETYVFGPGGPAPVPAIPALGPAGLVGLGALLGAVALVALGRLRRARGSRPLQSM